MRRNKSPSNWISSDLAGDMRILLGGQLVHVDGRKVTRPTRGTAGLPHLNEWARDVAKSVGLSEWADDETWYAIEAVLVPSGSTEPARKSVWAARVLMGYTDAPALTDVVPSTDQPWAEVMLEGSNTQTFESHVGMRRVYLAPSFGGTGETRFYANGRAERELVLELLNAIEGEIQARAHLKANEAPAHEGRTSSSAAAPAASTEKRGVVFRQTPTPRFNRRASTVLVKRVRPLLGTANAASGAISVVLAALLLVNLISAWLDMRGGPAEAALPADHAPTTAVTYVPSADLEVPDQSSEAWDHLIGADCDSQSFSSARIDAHTCTAAWLVLDPCFTVTEDVLACPRVEDVADDRHAPLLIREAGTVSVDWIKRDPGQQVGADLADQTHYPWAIELDLKNDQGAHVLCNAAPVSNGRFTAATYSCGIEQPSIMTFASSTDDFVSGTGWISTRFEGQFEASAFDSSEQIWTVVTQLPGESQLSTVAITRAWF